MNFDAAAHAAAPPYPDAPQLPHLSRRLRLQYEAAQTRWVLLYPEGMVKLNRSAGEILMRCTGTASVAEIVADLEAAFGATGLQGDVERFLDMARQQRWVELA